jgi:hypothetical protein
MCDPTVIAIAGGASAGLGAYGQYQQAQAAKETARHNQRLADMQADDARDRGVLESEKMGRKVGSFRGQQRAALAANGLDLTSGTPASLLEQTDYYGLEDQRTVASNTAREVAGYKNRAKAYGMQADNIHPKFQAFTTLLGGGSDVASKWYMMAG